MATAQGADVSAIQSTGDWSRYDLDFLIAKASEGRTTRDSSFAGHIAAARKKGIVPGGYHFGWPVQPVADEAGNYVAAVKSVAGAGVFTHWLDLEAYSDRRNVAGMTAAQIKSWATAWIAAVKKAFPGQRVGVYASLATFQAGWVPANADAYWVAQYPVAGLTWADAAKRPRPKLPATYGTPLIWQFASSNPALDRDLAYLSSTDLAAWAAGEEDDVALTADDKKWLQTQVAAIPKALLDLDDVPASRVLPNADYPKNDTWTVRYALQAAVEAGRQASVDIREAEQPQLTDTQVAALAEQLAAAPGFADALAEAVADKLAARLQS